MKLHMVLLMGFIAVLSMHCGTDSISDNGDVDGEQSSDASSNSSNTELSDSSSHKLSNESLSGASAAAPSSSDENEESSSESGLGQSDATQSYASSTLSSEGKIELSSSLETVLVDNGALLATGEWEDSTRYIFHEDSLRTYDLIIPTDDLAKIDANPMNEEYVSGAITFNGETLSDIKIRYKGSYGAFARCIDGFSGSSGNHKICPKLSMKVKFDKAPYNDRRFYGLKKLQFHAMPWSPSQLGERAAYWVYRNMGIPAPRAVHVKLKINGELQGLFLLVEQIDSRFSRYHFDGADGNVYKEFWPAEKNAITPANQLLEVLKTNENSSPDFSIVQGLEADLLAANNDVDALQAAIRKWMDASLLIKSILTAHVVYNADNPYMGTWDFTPWSNGGHNTYWVENPETQQIALIPWDVDGSLPIDESINFWKNDPDGNNLAPYQYTAFPGCPDTERSLFKVAWFCFADEWQEAFDAYALLEPEIERMLKKWEHQLRPTIEELAGLYPTGNYPKTAVSITEWEEAIQHDYQVLESQKIELTRLKNSVLGE